MAFTFPATDFDDREKLAAITGGFFHGVFQGGDLVESLTFAAGQSEEQTHKDLLALVDSVSRFKVPLYKKDDWQLLRLFESDRNRTSANAIRLDGSRRINDGFLIGDSVDRGFFAWQLPPGLIGATLICDKPSEQTRALCSTLDYFVIEDALLLTADPFQDDAFTIEPVFEDGLVVDRTCDLWLYDVSRDRDNVYYQFGYALGIKLPTSQPYKDLVNALFDNLVEGSTARALQTGFSALADVSLAKERETVGTIVRDTGSTIVVTDKNAYRFAADSIVLVEEGDSLIPGQAIVDAVQIFEFNRGQVPDEIQALAVGRGLLAEGFFQDIVFQNKIVPLVVELDVNGYTKVSFEVGGHPEDVALFWDTVHASGVAADQTLAMLMDQRPADARDTQPTALVLPTEVNPLGFLVTNIFRNNVIVALLKPHAFGPEALGVARTEFLRRVLPPQTACIVLVTLNIPTDTITMDGPGSETEPGYEETLSTFLAATFSETITPDLIVESLTCRAIACSC